MRLNILMKNKYIMWEHTLTRKALTHLRKKKGRETSPNYFSQRQRNPHWVVRKPETAIPMHPHRNTQRQPLFFPFYLFIYSLTENVFSCWILTSSNRNQNILSKVVLNTRLGRPQKSPWITLSHLELITLIYKYY